MPPLILEEEWRQALAILGDSVAGETDDEGSRRLAIVSAISAAYGARTNGSWSYKVMGS